MTELQRYLAEEVAEDHADGIITRREAMRRLGLLGVTGAAATSLLASFSGGAEAARAREVSARGRAASSGAREVHWAPVPRESITFASPRGPQGIDNAEIIETVHARRAPLIPVSTSARL
jgi:carboxymethylenebutenolidase